MADLPTAYPLRDLFDAAVRQRSVRLSCRRCAHVRIFSSHALWWLFHRRGWADRFRDVQRRAVCTICLVHTGEKVRDPELELVEEPATGAPLPMPSELDWKRELRRRR